MSKTMSISRPNEALRIELATFALAKKLERIVAGAARAGISVVVDADAVALRLIPTAVEKSGVDLRELGDVVKVHNACGSTAAVVSGNACSYGVR